MKGKIEKKIEFWKEKARNENRKYHELFCKKGKRHFKNAFYQNF